MVLKTKQGSLGLIVGLSVVSGAVAAEYPVTIDLEALLQQAETACAQKDVSRLAGLSRQIRQLAQQPALRERADFLNQLLSLFEAGVCYPAQTQPASTMRTKPSTVGTRLSPTTHTTHLQVATGYLDNVNQGSRHERIAIINPLNGLLVEGRLSERNQPLSSGFVSAQVTHRMVDVAHGSVTTATLARQTYTDEPDFSTTGVALSRQQTFAKDKEASAYLNIIRDDKGNTEQRVGGVYYQPLAATAKQKTDMVVGLEYITYPKQKLFKSTVAHVALERRHLLANGSEVAVRGKLEFDHALEARPGGDRQEVEASLTWKGKPPLAGWQPSAGMKAAYKRDSKPFDTKLYGDSTRTQVRTGVDLGITKSLDKDKKLYVSYQYGKTQDKEVALFDQPASNALGITFEVIY